jgi:hypothetical protein
MASGAHSLDALLGMVDMDLLLLLLLESAESILQAQPKLLKQLSSEYGPWH